MFCCKKLNRILEKVEKMSQAIDNLVAAEASLEATVAAAVVEIAKLAAELAAIPNTDPQVQAVVDKMTALNTSLTAAVASGG